MQITQGFTWDATNWPLATPASQYAVFQMYPGPVTQVATTSTPSVVLTYDDAASLIYQVRPTDGTNFGPELIVFTINYAPCRGWLREKVRFALADPTSAEVLWTDEELNGFINEGITEINRLFPVERDTTITLLPQQEVNNMLMGVRAYDLPVDYLEMNSVCYKAADGHFQRWLTYKPFKGGESTAQSFFGYHKLGVLITPYAGRLYSGHYDIYENQLIIDWDPFGNGDTLTLHYDGKRPYPTSDADVLIMSESDAEIISIYTQWKAWLRLEGQDARLSRWRDREDGSRRDDMSTVKHSNEVRKIYNQLLNDRREYRPRAFRLERR